MSEYLIQKETLDNIAIQTKSLVGQSDKMTPSDMIENLAYANKEVGDQTDMLADVLNTIYDTHPFACMDTLMRRETPVLCLNNVETIGPYAFYFCTNLTSVSFPQATTIGSNAFVGCYSLASVSFPQATTIGSYAFYSCTSLTTISFPAATTIGNYAFEYCPSLTTADFPQATTIGEYAFWGCNSLTSVSFPQVTSIGRGAFRDCARLTSVSFPQATSIGDYAFANCTSLTSIYLGASSLCNLVNSYAFSSAGITSTTGSIFVPTSLVTAYKSATNWVYFSSRIFAFETAASLNGV